MIKALPQRDIGSQEVAMMNLQLPIMEMKIRNFTNNRFFAFNFIHVSLDSSRKVKDPKYCSRESSVIKFKMLDFYAKRMELFRVHQEADIFFNMNINQFARTYHVLSNGRLSKHKFPAKNILTFTPNATPSVTDLDKMIEYCKLNLIRYKVWYDSPTTAWDAAGDRDRAIITEQQSFLQTEFAIANVSLLSRERKYLNKWLSNKNEIDKDEKTEDTHKIIPDFAVLMGPSGAQTS